MDVRLSPEQQALRDAAAAGGRPAWAPRRRLARRRRAGGQARRRRGRRRRGESCGARPTTAVRRWASGVEVAIVAEELGRGAGRRRVPRADPGRRAPPASPARPAADPGDPCPGPSAGTVAAAEPASAFGAAVAIDAAGARVGADRRRPTAARAAWPGATGRRRVGVDLTWALSARRPSQPRPAAARATRGRVSTDDLDRVTALGLAPHDGRPRRARCAGAVDLARRLRRRAPPVRPARSGRSRRCSTCWPTPWSWPRSVPQRRPPRAPGPSTPSPPRRAAVAAAAMRQGLRAGRPGPSARRPSRSTAASATRGSASPTCSCGGRCCRPTLFGGVGACLDPGARCNGIGGAWTSVTAPDEAAFRPRLPRVAAGQQPGAAGIVDRRRLLGGPAGAGTRRLFDAGFFGHVVAHRHRRPGAARRCTRRSSTTSWPPPARRPGRASATSSSGLPRARQRRHPPPVPPRHRQRAGPVVPGLQRARRRLRPGARCAPGPTATATSSSSPATRSGPATPTSPTGASCWPAPTTTCRSTRASPPSPCRMDQPGIEQRPLKMINGVTREFGEVQLRRAPGSPAAEHDRQRRRRVAPGHDRGRATSGSRASSGFVARYRKTVHGLVEQVPADPRRYGAEAQRDLAWAMVEAEMLRRHVSAACPTASTASTTGPRARSTSCSMTWTEQAVGHAAAVGRRPRRRHGAEDLPVQPGPERHGRHVADPTEPDRHSHPGVAHVMSCLRPARRVVQVEVDGPIRVIRLNRPDQLNATNRELHTALAALFAPARRRRRRPGRRASPATAGRSRPAATSATSTASPSDVDLRHGDAGARPPDRDRHGGVPGAGGRRGQRAGRRARVQPGGPVSDIVYMAESAHLADPHVLLGLVAADGGPVTWPLLTSLQLAKEYALTGDRIPARRAAEIGLVNHVVPDGESCSTQAMACARKIATLPAAGGRGHQAHPQPAPGAGRAGRPRLRLRRRGPLVHLARAAGQHRSPARTPGRPTGLRTVRRASWRCRRRPGGRRRGVPAGARAVGGGRQGRRRRPAGQTLRRPRLAQPHRARRHDGGMGDLRRRAGGGARASSAGSPIRLRCWPPRASTPRWSAAGLRGERCVAAARRCAAARPGAVAGPPPVAARRAPRWHAERRGPRTSSTATGPTELAVVTDRQAGVFVVDRRRRDGHEEPCIDGSFHVATVTFDGVPVLDAAPDAGGAEPPGARRGAGRHQRRRRSGRRSGSSSSPSATLKDRKQFGVADRLVPGRRSTWRSTCTSPSSGPGPVPVRRPADRRGRRPAAAGGVAGQVGRRRRPAHSPCSTASSSSAGSATRGRTTCSSTCAGPRCGELLLGQRIASSIGGTGGVAAWPAWRPKLAFDDDVEAFRAELAAWLDEHTPDAGPDAERPDCSSAHIPPWARTWQRAMFDAGWLVPGNPPEYGGRNASLLEQFVHQEELGRRRIHAPSFNPQGL